MELLRCCYGLARNSHSIRDNVQQGITKTCAKSQEVASSLGSARAGSSPAGCVHFSVFSVNLRFLRRRARFLWFLAASYRKCCVNSSPIRHLIRSHTSVIPQQFLSESSEHLRQTLSEHFAEPWGTLSKPLAKPP